MFLEFIISVTAVNLSILSDLKAYFTSSLSNIRSTLRCTQKKLDVNRLTEFNLFFKISKCSI